MSERYVVRRKSDGKFLSWDGWGRMDWLTAITHAGRFDESQRDFAKDFGEIEAPGNFEVVAESEVKP